MSYLEAIESTPLVELNRARVEQRVSATLADARAWPQLVPLLPLDVRQWLLDARFAARARHAELAAASVDGAGERAESGDGRARARELTAVELYPIVVQLADAAEVPWAITQEHCERFVDVFDATARAR